MPGDVTGDPAVAHVCPEPFRREDVPGTLLADVDDRLAPLELDGWDTARTEQN